MTYHAAPAPRGSLPLGIVLGVIVGAIAVMFAWFALVDDPDRATPATTPVPSVAPSAEPTPEASATTEPSAEPTASPEATPDAKPTATPEATPGATPEPTANPAIVTELPVGTWVTVLASLPKDAVTAEQAIDRAARESRNGYTAIVIDTNEFSGLNAGYWAVVIPGAESRSASNEVCRGLGMAVNDKCYPREIKG